MIDERVRGVVTSIVEQEKNRSSTDWKAVEAEASAAIAYINENGVEIDNLIYHFLEDADARRVRPTPFTRRPAFSECWKGKKTRSESREPRGVVARRKPIPSSIRWPN